MKIKILLCFGIRPEAIKMCSLVNELKNDDTFKVEVCVTAQHNQKMSKAHNPYGNGNANKNIIQYLKQKL